jgi:hypothetical protein
VLPEHEHHEPSNGEIRRLLVSALVSDLHQKIMGPPMERRGSAALSCASRTCNQQGPDGKSHLTLHRRPTVKAARNVGVAAEGVAESVHGAFTPGHRLTAKAREIHESN